MSGSVNSAFGISVGDIVSTSYGTGPYVPYVVLSVSPPRYHDRFVGVLVIRTWQVIDLVCRHVDRPDRGPDHRAYLGSIRVEGNRWFTDQNDEIFVVRKSAGKAVQLSMFNDDIDPERDLPYEFQPGVDYSHDAWKCTHCGKDFNEATERGRGPVWHCGDVCDKLILMQPRVAPPAADLSSCQAYLGLRRLPNGYIG